MAELTEKELKKKKRSIYSRGFFYGFGLGLIIGVSAALLFLSFLGIEYYRNLLSGLMP